VNGDGCDDLLVGAPLDDEGAAEAGAAYLVLGAVSPASISLTDADAKYAGKAASELAGAPVAGAGDVDGDGYADFLVGASSNNDAAASAGAAYLVLGGPSPISGSLASAIEYSGLASDDRAGQALAGAGDLDRDGFDDFLIGAPGARAGAKEPGAAYLVLGGPSPASAPLSDADVRYVGVMGFGNAGISVAGGGDVDADGVLDVLVGDFQDSEGGTDAGAAFLVLGGS
jgi:hypothetical protein